jgi:hypothetical protein
MCVLGGFCFCASQSPGDTTNSSARDSIGAGLRLRSILLDFESLLFIGGVSGSVDVDFVRLASSNFSTLGVRFAVDRYAYGGPGGSAEGSPFTDFNILLRHTASGSVLRFDVYFGYCYYTNSTRSSLPPSGGLKFGVEIRVKFLPHIMSLLAKFSKPLGVGLSFGWDS